MDEVGGRAVARRAVRMMTAVGVVASVVLGIRFRATIAVS